MKYLYRLVLFIIIMPIIVPALFIALMFNKSDVLNNINELPVTGWLFKKAKLD